MTIDKRLKRRIQDVRRLAREGRPSGRRGYSAEIREAVLECTRQMRAEGASLRVCAAEFGVSVEALRKWLRAASSRPAPPKRPAERSIKPVTVVPAAPARAAPLCLRLPNGVEVRGLSVEQAAALLQRLV
jgi:transposase